MSPKFYKCFFQLWLSLNAWLPPIFFFIFNTPYQHLPKPAQKYLCTSRGDDHLQGEQLRYIRWKLRNVDCAICGDVDKNWCKYLKVIFVIQLWFSKNKRGKLLHNCQCFSISELESQHMIVFNYDISHQYTIGVLRGVHVWNSLTLMGLFFHCSLWMGKSYLISSR